MGWNYHHPSSLMSLYTQHVYYAQNLSCSKRLHSRLFNNQREAQTQGFMVTQHIACETVAGSGEQ